MKREKFVNYNLEELNEAVKLAMCWADVCRALNVTICSFNYKRFQRLCRENDISFEHFDIKKTFKRGKHEWTEENLFVEDCQIHRGHFRTVLVRLGFYTGKCDECGMGDEWNGNPLTLEIDHINGVSSDNRKENLRWLCPNCHSQTETYRRRSAHRKE